MSIRRVNARDLVSRLLERAVASVNGGVSRTLTARRSKEVPPAHSRHLTDTRTRVSQLLEYAIAYEMNRAVQDEYRGCSLSAVLWNKFPDLVIRDEQGVRAIGLEVKALHTAAEEKSANFSTPLQVIRQNEDFIVVLNWGWHRVQMNGTDMVYPHIHRGLVFDAWLLAKIRDYTWLYNHDGRRKAFDLCSPLICGGNDSAFKAEEGNLGKLMRIELSGSIPASVPGYSEMKEESTRYEEFKAETIALSLQEAFKDVCYASTGAEPMFSHFKSYPASLQWLGASDLPSGQKFLLLAGKGQLQSLPGLGALADGTKAIWLSSKLNWKLYETRSGTWRNLGEGQKPESELERIIALL